MSTTCPAIAQECGLCFLPVLTCLTTQTSFNGVIFPVVSLRAIAKQIFLCSNQTWLEKRKSKQFGVRSWAANFNKYIAETIAPQHTQIMTCSLSPQTYPSRASCHK